MSSPTPVTTIADIARIAGVGTATVDRVLNRRPGVNAETVQRVLQVVAELGGPAPRGRPRKGENFRFAFVLPDDQSPFVSSVDRQIAQAASDFRHQHITEVTHRLDPADASQFAAQLAQLGEHDGIALMAPDLPPVKQAINDLVRSGVHVVTLFSDVAGSMRETHVGADNRAAGRTAGLLLGRLHAPAEADTFLLCSQATRLSAEIERRIGFAQVFEERFAGRRVLRTPDLPADDDGAARALEQFIDSGAVAAGAIAGLYNVGCATTGIVRTLAARGLTERVGVISHEVTDSHRALLAGGALAFLLHQDVHYCVLTAARVLRALCENVRGALNVVQPRVEILTAENLH